MDKVYLGVVRASYDMVALWVRCASCIDEVEPIIG